MIRNMFRRVGYERFAIALTGLCVASLYVLVALDYARTDTAADPAAVAPHRTTPEAAPPPVQSAALRDEPEVVAPSEAGRRTVPVRKPIQVFSISSSEKIVEVFRRIGYRLDSVREHGEVPRVFFATLPVDLTTIRAPAKRKAVFIQATLPLILQVNELILHDRARIEALRDVMAAGEPLSAADRDWLDAKLEEYRLEKLDFDVLLRRVDVIPTSLALAQSAQESGWGTSRFAREGNALFGQRVWAPHQKGMVPKARPDGARFRVRAFDRLIDGVKSYARNLNIHRAYYDFRMARAALREEGERIDGYSLAENLHEYSEGGVDYVKAIRAIIRGNRLRFFDSVRLGDRITRNEDEGRAVGPPPDA